jgi:hypothetical protein
MSFAKDLDKATLNLKGYTEITVRAILLDLTRLIIKASPVDTGRFRGNWQASFGSPKGGKLQRKDKSKDGANTADLADKVIANIEMGQTFYLTNNLPYARRLEYGYSKQAPNGMLRINLMAVQSMLAKANKK